MKNHQSDTFCMDHLMIICKIEGDSIGDRDHWSTVMWNCPSQHIVRYPTVAKMTISAYTQCTVHTILLRNF